MRNCVLSGCRLGARLSPPPPPALARPHACGAARAQRFCARRRAARASQEEGALSVFSLLCSLPSLTPSSPLTGDLELEPSQVARVQLPLVRRRQRMEFTCNKCGTCVYRLSLSPGSLCGDPGQRSARLVNPEALARGTVFVQCATMECAVWHKVADAFQWFGTEYSNLQGAAPAETDAEQL